MSEDKPDNRNGGETAIAEAIQDNTSVSDYEGFLSDIHELHATEWGLMVGITLALLQVSPELGAVAGALTGFKSVQDVRRDGIPGFVKRNASYAVVFATIGYAGVTLLAPFAF